MYHPRFLALNAQVLEIPCFSIISFKLMSGVTVTFSLRISVIGTGFHRQFPPFGLMGLVWVRKLGVLMGSWDGGGYGEMTDVSHDV